MELHQQSFWKLFKHLKKRNIPSQKESRVHCKLEIAVCVVLCELELVVICVNCVNLCEHKT